MDLGLQLKKYREQAGYTQAKEFAKKLGIPYTRYVAYENKGVEPKLEVLCNIAGALGVSLDELLGVNRFQRCKRKVESTQTMTVLEQTDGKIVVKFSYDEKLVNYLLNKAKKVNLTKDCFPLLTKEDKIYANKEDFCQQVEEADANFFSKEENLEAWEECLDDEYKVYVIEKDFNKVSCIPLKWWQIKAISACMAEELMDDSPESRTPEAIATKQKNIDEFFSNRQPRTYTKKTRRFPKGYRAFLD